MDPPQSSIHALNTTAPRDLTQRTSTYERPFTHEGNYLVFSCHHFTNDCLNEYVQFTVYHLEVSRVPIQCCEAQPISTISPKT